MTVRARGWAGAVGLAVVTGLCSIVHPGLLIFVPLALMLVALPPRRPLLMAVGALGAVLMLLSSPGDALLDFGRGWSLIVGAWFLIAFMLVESDWFLGRGLLAVAGAFATVGVFAVLRPGALGAVESAVQSEAASVVDLLERIGSESGASEAVVDAARWGVELQTILSPALLALSSLSALAVAWWVYRRLVASDPNPLRPLREFRFADGLVWLLVGGLLLVLLPISELADRAGSNLLAFMAALYALRGLAVLLVLGGMPGPLGMVLMVVVAILLYPMVMAATIVVGLTDTWLDIRTRREPGSRPGN